MHPTVRRLLLAALWVAVLGCAVWSVTRVFGLERGWPWVQLMAFTPYVAAAAVVVAAVALGTRRWVAGGVAVVAALALCVVVAPRAINDGRRAAGGPSLKVLSANLLAGNGDERQVLDLVRRLNVDVLALQEFSPGDLTGLAEAGADEVLPYRALYPRDGTGGSALLSRHPLRERSVRTHAGGFLQAQATVDVPGAPPVLVESVHPTAPWGAPAMAYWERDLRDQPPATVDGPLRVLAGDFNATLDHAALRRLIDTGYRDAASVVGSGLRPSWPYDEKWFMPGVTLDRVLADRRIGVRAARPYRIRGTDHKAFYAELVLPTA
ncbi:endonuclease/exonuclease/phosphatase family protein [Virgisporangium ochraceum]|uniref:Endonuclease n=1 Tax=Virgisporangium ochraceum TaxID=65505 RepID=A0A8J4EBE3_9ACTN|nr:endonuclease/exonuclease/phosphatase family protein [Virgisporangium ochraceum]GIJ69280.1 endonuclease [Virgisporangium ochraceum]